MTQRSKQVPWLILGVVLFITVISFPIVYSLSQSGSSTLHTSSTPGSSSSTTSNESTTNTATPPNYGSPQEICAGLPNQAIGRASSNPNSSDAYFLIVEADIGSSYEGINGSAYNLDTYWPEITVYQGQKVTIHVVNCPSSPEPHGFAIGNYFAGGVTLSPGQSYTVTFVANKVGSFTVFCNVFCAIHQYMQNGRLTVKPLPTG